MRLFLDLFTGEQIISDGQKMEMKFEDTTAEVASRMVVVGNEEVDVGCGNAFGGKNEDEEEGGAGGAPVEKVNNLINQYQYQESPFEKTDWKKYFGDYMKRLLPKIPEARAQAFKKGAKDFGAYIIKNFDDLTIYTPRDYDRENSLIYSYWKNESDEAPTFIFFLDGCRTEKV